MERSDNAHLWDMMDPDARELLQASLRAGRPRDLANALQASRDYLEQLPHPELPEMAEISDHTVDGPGGPLPVRIFRPHGQSSPAPAIVYFHPGGMAMGSIHSSQPTAVQLAHGSGATVISVDYRLAPEHPLPAQPEDAYAATCWVADNAALLGVDPHRLCTAGDSAGGTLAAAVPLMSRDRGGPAIFCQVLLYTGVDFDPEAASYRELAQAPGLTADDVEYLKRLAGPEEAYRSPHVTPARAEDLSGLPQAIVAVAEVDPIRDWTENYALRLRDAGVQVTLTRYPGLHHGFIMRTKELARARLAMAEITALLRAKFDNPLPW